MSSQPLCQLWRLGSTTNGTLEAAAEVIKRDGIQRVFASVVDEIDRAGHHYQLGPPDTVIEADWDSVMPVLRPAEARLRTDYRRVFVVLTRHDHVGADNRLHAAVEDVGVRQRRRSRARGGQVASRDFTTKETFAVTR